MIRLLNVDSELMTVITVRFQVSGETADREEGS